MKKINKISLFSGIEAFDMALRNIGVPVNTLALSEINEYSSLSCCAVHGYESELNKGDVCEFDGTKFNDVDLLTHGSPCTSMSLEGKKEGADKGSGTASSLLWESVRIIRECLPKVVVWENVYTVTNKKNIHNFEAYLNELEEIGYTNYHNIYCGLDYDTPQNRKRMVVVSIHNTSDLTFTIPNKIKQTKRLSTLLETNVDDKYDLEQKVVEQLLLDDKNLLGQIRIKNGTKQGWIHAEEGDGIDFNRPESKTRRGRVQKERSNTLLTSKTLGTYQNDKLRYFTPLEYWRLQGFKDEDYYTSRKALEEYQVKTNKKFDVDTQLYFQAGNSIPVNILEEVFKELYIKNKN